MDKVDIQSDSIIPGTKVKFCLLKLFIVKIVCVKFLMRGNFKILVN